MSIIGEINEEHARVKKLEQQLSEARERAEAAEQKLAEYRANRITVDEAEMVERLRRVGEIYLNDDVWLYVQDGAIALETVTSQNLMMRCDAIHMITAGVACLRYMEGQDDEQ